MKLLSVWLALFFLVSVTKAAVQPWIVLQRIHRHVQARPDLLTNAMVGGILFGGSDMLAQWMEQRQPSAAPTNAKPTKETASKTLAESNFYLAVNQRRFVSAGVLGACLSSVLYPAGYGMIDNIWKGHDLVSLVQKSVIEIFTVGLFANAISMVIRGLTSTKGGETSISSLYRVLRHVKDELPEVTLHDFGLWFPYNMAAFGLIPLQARPITTALLDACWQTYMSLRSNVDAPDPKKLA